MLNQMAHFYTGSQSNRLKYCSGSGSRNLIFNDSVPVQVQDFSKIWVQLHQNLKVRARFGFIETKFLRFRFGSDSLNPNFKGSGSVRVQDHKTVHKATGKPKFLSSSS